MEDLQNAPKVLTFEFHPNRSKNKTTFILFSANGYDPLASERVIFVVSQLRSLRSLRCDNNWIQALQAYLTVATPWAEIKASIFSEFFFRRKPKKKSKFSTEKTEKAKKYRYFGPFCYQNVVF